MSVLPVVLIFVALIGSGWIDLRLMRSGRITMRTFARLWVARIPASVALLGLAAGASLIGAVLVAAIAGAGAAVGYRAAMWAIQQS